MGMYVYGYLEGELACVCILRISGVRVIMGMYVYGYQE